MDMTNKIQHLDIYPAYGQGMEKAPWWKRLRHRIIPRHTWLPLRNEWRILLVRLFGGVVRRRYHGARDLWINLGSGKHGKPGWVNVDIKGEDGVNCLYDCRKSLPFPDRSVAGIFCEHFLEHLDYTEEIPWFLTECHRVLKPGGVLRIIVPDLEKYLKAYCQGGWDELSRVRPLNKDRRDSYFKNMYNTRMELVNVLFHQGCEHKFGYDHETLEFLLLRYGFSRVCHQEFGKSLLTELCLDLSARASESLYVEAVK